MNPNITFQTVGQYACVSITQKQILAEIPNLVFYICAVCKFFMKFGQIGAHENIRKHYGVWTEFFVVAFYCI